MVDAELHEHADARLRKGRGARASNFLQAALGLNAVGRYPLLFAFGLCGGAAWYVSAWTEPSLSVLLVAFAVSLLALWIVSKRLRAVPLILSLMVLMTGFAGGVLSGKLAMLRVSHPVISDMIGPVMIEGWVEAIEPAKRGVRVRLIVHAIDDVPNEALPSHVRVTHTSRLEVEAGRFVRCWAVLRPPPAPIVKGDYAFDRQAYFEGLGAVGYVQGRCRGGALGAPVSLSNQFALWVAKHRRNLGHFVNQSAGERAGGFAAALASGDRSFMASADQEALRGSGLAHLLAISGLHMGIVGGLIYLMAWRGLALIEPIALRIPVQKPAAIAALLASLTYLILSGASVSTQRAFIMAAVLFGAVLVDRTALSLRSLAIAMIIVVILSPWSVLTPGFQMSFAATGALIAAYEAWQRQRRKRGETSAKGIGFWLKSLVVTSFVSGVATMPFALYHFDRIAGFGLLANLVAMPVISLASAPLAGVALVAAPFGLSEFPLRLFGYSLEMVLWVAHTFDAMAPGGAGMGKAMPETVFVLFSLALVFAIVLTGWQKRLLLAGGLIAAGIANWFLSPATSLHWAPSGEVFLVDQTGKVERIRLSTGDGLAPLRFVDEPVSADCSHQVCWRELADLKVVMLPPGQDINCAQLEDADLILAAQKIERPQCNYRVTSWPDVSSSNGVSWRIHGSKLIRAEKASCGARAWKPCAATTVSRTFE